MVICNTTFFFKWCDEYLHLRGTIHFIECHLRLWSCLDLLCSPGPHQNGKHWALKVHINSVTDTVSPIKLHKVNKNRWEHRWVAYHMFKAFGVKDCSQMAFLKLNWNQIHIKCMLTHTDYKTTKVYLDQVQMEGRCSKHFCTYERPYTLLMRLNLCPTPKIAQIQITFQTILEQRKKENLL